MGISVFLPQWNLATWMELKIRFTETPWNRALSEDEQKEKNMMILPQEVGSSRVHTYHTSGRLETTVSQPWSWLWRANYWAFTSEKRGRETIFSVLAVKPAPHMWELSSTGFRSAQPDTVRHWPGDWGCQSGIGKNSEIWLLCVLDLYLSVMM